jgi:two-component system phosphate regulon sensor histidine kinase PhoR
MGECAEARTGDGRFLYPVVALEGAAVEEMDAIAGWIEAHEGFFSPRERDATLEELSAAQGLQGPARARALGALQASHAGREEVVVALRSEAAAVALRDGPDRAGMLRFRTAGAIGVLRVLDDGRLAGLVVHAGSLGRALAKGSPGLAADQRAELATGAGAPAVPHARASVSPGLELRVLAADPAAIDKRASRSRRILAAIGAGALVVSFGLLALLWARMRAARRTSELRVDFVSAISHELRTPVSSLRMLSELLVEGRVEPAEQREIHEALAREAKRLGQTVERMLSLGRVAKGKLAPVRSEANVSGVVAEAIDAFEERCGDMPRIERALDPATAPIDAGQIRLAVDNLLDNARKYAPEGTPYRVRVCAERQGVSIRVEDRGPGIARRDQRRIFEPFERLDDKLSRSTEGSGLGLSLVRSVARAHGGWARVESEPGEGAAFVLFIAGRKP